MEDNGRGNHLVKLILLVCVIAALAGWIPLPIAIIGGIMVAIFYGVVKKLPGRWVLVGAIIWWIVLAFLLLSGILS